ncbi:MAG: nucleotidyltransferase family protein [Bacteroides sp.]
MSTTDLYIHKLHQYLPICSAKYGVERMGIFGSVARREQTDESDVDIYIEGSLRGMFALGSIKSDLEELLGTTVDVVRIREGINPMLLRKIREEGIYV